MYTSRAQKIIKKCPPGDEKVYPLFRAGDKFEQELEYKSSLSLFENELYTDGKNSKEQYTFAKTLDKIFDDLLVEPLSNAQFGGISRKFNRDPPETLSNSCTRLYPSGSSIRSTSPGSSVRSTSSGSSVRSSSGYGSATPESTPNDFLNQTPSPPTGTKRRIIVLDQTIIRPASKKDRKESNIVDAIINKKHRHKFSNYGKSRREEHNSSSRSISHNTTSLIPEVNPNDTSRFINSNAKSFPSLVNIASKAVKNNFLGPGYVAPYVLPVIDKLKHIFTRLSSKELLEAEKRTPHLWRYTDEHWKNLCKRRFSGRRPKSEESWRDAFLRCKEERERRR